MNRAQKLPETFAHAFWLYPGGGCAARGTGGFDFAGFKRKPDA